ncbi:hypothetical protein [Fibrella forsythiae]|uniref:C4-dicarboxylate ABC transporter n=1 Tax=Fibrella forsythiae TaxID=2817061 RepID=A0ABS3JHA1_9BACT|nr:hypothetical protein [Fibrella forsythiae]MBO0949384.1 hypothetical protein [Fibrella forsythiae]
MKLPVYTTLVYTIVMFLIYRFITDQELALLLVMSKAVFMGLGIYFFVLRRMRMPAKVKDNPRFSGPDAPASRPAR